jgi:tetratricopeptide (TPR) repeat protein
MESKVEFNPKAIAYNDKATNMIVSGFYDPDSLEKSLAYFDSAVAIDPAYYHAYLNKANAYIQLDELSQAIASMDQALAIKPDFAEVVMGQAGLYDALGDTTTGRQHYEEALELYRQRWQSTHHYFSDTLHILLLKTLLDTTYRDKALLIADKLEAKASSEEDSISIAYFRELLPVAHRDSIAVQYREK